MVFELWEYTDYVSKCFARRTEEEVRPMFHDMKIAEQRCLRGNIWIIRVK